MAHQEKTASIRGVMREKTLTLHAPPPRLYSAKRVCGGEPNPCRPHAWSSCSRGVRRAAPQAFSFPFIEASNLLGESVRWDDSADGLFASRLTLLGCTGSRMAEPMVNGWLDGVTAATESVPAMQTVRLSLIEATALTWLQRPLLWSIRATVPAEQHGSFYCHFGKAGALKRQLRMENSYLGYVCLVDRTGTVRWHVHSNEPPTDEQVASLAALVVAQQGVADARLKQEG